MRNNKISGTRCGCDLPDDICSEEMERCVLCWRLTDVPKTRPVSQRIGYIEGVGQLCESCYCTLLPWLFFFVYGNKKVDRFIGFREQLTSHSSISGAACVRICATAVPPHSACT